jgi:predicted RNase H-like HicB family nuclease
METAVRIFEVRAIWDAEARVWVATSNDIPGLATEAESYDRLIERVLLIAPELLEENSVPSTQAKRAIRFVAERNEALAAA